MKSEPVYIRPRLLRKNQAAAYCGVTAATFDGICPVRPISLGEGVRMQRYDIQALDKWIDGLEGGLDERNLADRLLDEF